MAFGLNRAEVIGRLGADVTVNHLQSGGRVANLSVATDESYLNKQTGERVDKTEWHRIVTFQDGLIDMLEKHAVKGRLVYVAGKLQTRRWSKPGEDGDRFSTEILLVPGGRIQFLDKPNGTNGNGASHLGRPGARERPGDAGRRQHRARRRLRRRHPVLNGPLASSSLPPRGPALRRRSPLLPPASSPPMAPESERCFAQAGASTGQEREHGARQHLRPRGRHRPRLRHPGGGGAHPPSHRRGALAPRAQPPRAALRVPLRRTAAAARASPRRPSRGGLRTWPSGSGRISAARSRCSAS